MRVLAPDAPPEVQCLGAEPDTCPPSRAAKRLQILDQPGVGDVFDIGHRDVVLDTPVNLDTEVRPDTVDDDQARTRL